MNITGIICEYNPFHLGHLRQMEAARAASGPDTAIVCVMGGDFVQRGEAAVLSRHARAEMAVRCGADLVVGLPVPWAIASAERFAAGGVALLDALGADSIAFGCECGDAGRLRAVALELLKGETREEIRRELRSGVSYPAAREAVLARRLGGEAELLRSPNNILAVEYLKAMAASGSAMRPLAVPRFGASHDGAASGGVASASGIRAMLRRGEDPAAFMPAPALDVLRREVEAGRGPVRPEAAEAAILYRLRTMSDQHFQALPDGGEGLWRRFMSCARSMPTLEQVLEGTKTRRYALSRLRRMATAAYLGVTAQDQAGKPPYIRVLALGERGRAVLRTARRAGVLPVITKPAAARLDAPAGEIYALDALAGDLYALLYPDPARRAGGGEWTASPFIMPS